MLAIAYVYWLSATLGQMLHAPPVYATAVWPPSGIALGVALVWGRRSWPGIALGAFLSNGQELWVNHFSLGESLLPAGMALGALSQAALVAFLIRRWAGYPSLLDDHRHMARFLLLTGPLGCCISASFGTCLLVLYGNTPLAGFAINWVTWWVGDTMGALVFTPLMLIAFGQPRAAWSPRWLTVALPLMICFALATTVFVRVRAGDSHRKFAEFNNLVDQATYSIESSLQDFTVITSAMQGMFLATGELGCQGFKTFTDILLEHKAGLHALEWAKLVLEGERKRFEQGDSLCAGAWGGVTERDAQGVIVPAGVREEYLPVLFINPLSPNLPALGFDLYSERLRAETIRKARDSGRIMVTPPLKLVQEPAGKFGVLMVAPLYRKGGDKESLAGRQANFTGVVIGVLRIEGLVGNALGKLGGHRSLLYLQLQDVSADGHAGVLYSESGFIQDSNLFQQRRLQIGGRDWLLSASGSENDFGHGWFIWFVLAGGMLFSGLLGGFLLLLTGKTMNMEALIAKRTVDLASTNQRLREEIEERASAEREKARLALVAEKTASAIIITDAQGLIEWVNPAFTLLSGYELHEVIGRRPGDFLQGPDTDPGVVAHMAGCIARQLGFDVELLNYPKNGSSYWLHLQAGPVFDPQGQITHFIAVGADISERKANEKAIQQLNRSYQDLLAAASEVSIVATDPQGCITLFNRGAERMLGYRAVDMVGKTSPSIFHLPAEMEARGRELSEELGYSVTGFAVFTAIPDMHGQEVREWTYVCKDGLCIWVSLVATQIKSEEGETTGYLGIAQNITERKAAELAMQRAKLAADKANQAKSEFLANMSHEIRTPMNGVLGMIELLRGTRLGSEQRELIETARHSANALMEIINDILDFSKIEAGKLVLDSVDFNVCELCESVCSLLAVPAQAKGLEFNCFVQPDINAHVRGDSTRLRQVLVNLIGNAVKFTLRGEISVEASCVFEDERSMLMRFSVQDTGIGMRAEEVNRLFMPFEQAEHGTTRRFGGTGLGLSISKSLVELMGGEITVESADNAGSTFQFTVKLDKSLKAGQQAENIKLSGYHVLIADDNKTNLEILAKTLKSRGAIVSATGNGVQALAMLETAYAAGKPFNLALLDQVMPDLGGQQIILAMTGNPAMDGLPVILLCPAGAIAEPVLGRADKVVWLSKPVRQSQLFDAMASLLGHGPIKRPAGEAINQAVLPQFAGKRLLLVEDNLVNQRVALKMLERFGLTARLANNGAEALTELEQNTFDLVFMDCQIPIMDGYSVTKRQRDRELSQSLAHTPIVALTANAIQGDHERSLAAGMDDHLTKPLSFGDLEQALTRWLSNVDALDQRQMNVNNVNSEVSMSEPAWDCEATLQDTCFGDVEFLESLKTKLISEASQLKPLIGTAVAPQPPEVIATAAHTLKGMAAHFHAKAVVEVSAEVEKLARTGGISSADPLVERLQHEVDRLIAAVTGEA